MIKVTEYTLYNQLHKQNLVIYVTENNELITGSDNNPELIPISSIIHTGKITIQHEYKKLDIEVTEKEWLHCITSDMYVLSDIEPGVVSVLQVLNAQGYGFTAKAMRYSAWSLRFYKYRLSNIQQAFLQEKESAIEGVRKTATMFSGDIGPIQICTDTGKLIGIENSDIISPDLELSDVNAIVNGSLEMIGSKTFLVRADEVKEIDQDICYDVLFSEIKLIIKAEKLSQQELVEYIRDYMSPKGESLTYTLSISREQFKALRGILKQIPSYKAVTREMTLMIEEKVRIPIILSNARIERLNIKFIGRSLKIIDYESNIGYGFTNSDGLLAIEGIYSFFKDIRESKSEYSTFLANSSLIELRGIEKPGILKITLGEFYELLHDYICNLI